MCLFVVTVLTALALLKFEDIGSFLPFDSFSVVVFLELNPAEDRIIGYKSETCEPVCRHAP